MFFFYKVISYGVYNCNVEGLGLSERVTARTCGPGGDNTGQWDKEAPSCEGDHKERD